MNKFVIHKMIFDSCCSVCVNEVKEGDNVFRIVDDLGYPVYICMDCIKEISKLAKGEGYI